MACNSKIPHRTLILKRSERDQIAATLFLSQGELSTRVNAEHAMIMGLQARLVMGTLKSGHSAAKKVWMFSIRTLFVAFGRCPREADAMRAAMKKLKRPWITFSLIANKYYITKSSTAVTYLFSESTCFVLATLYALVRRQ